MLVSRWSFAITVALATTLLLCPAGARAEDPASVAAEGQAIVAVVNGQPIPESRLKPVIEKADSVGAANKASAQLPSFRQKALAQVIDTELLFQAGRKLTIPDLEKRVTEEIHSLKAGYPETMKNKSDDEISDLALRQVTIREYLIKNDLLDPRVADEEVRAFYEKNKHNFASAEEMVHVRHILVLIPEDATEEQKQAARGKIEQAAKALAEGKDFDAVAKEYSEDAVAASGGDLGERKRGYMPPEFDAVAFTIEPGKPSDIIQTAFGYHIIDVVRRYPKGYIAPFEDVRDFFTTYLQKEFSRKKMADHLAMLRENATIEIHEPGNPAGASAKSPK